VGFLVPNRHLTVKRAEAEHLNVYVPNAWRKVERVAAGLIGVRNHLSTALAGGHGCSGDELVGGPNGTAVPARAEQGWDERQYTNQEAHLSCIWFAPRRERVRLF
jgi:hypothetical protein